MEIKDNFLQELLKKGFAPVEQSPHVESVQGSVSTKRMVNTPFGQAVQMAEVATMRVDALEEKYQVVIFKDKKYDASGELSRKECEEKMTQFFSIFNRGK